MRNNDRSNHQQNSNRAIAVARETTKSNSRNRSFGRSHRVNMGKKYKQKKNVIVTLSCIHSTSSINSSSSRSSSSRSNSNSNSNSNSSSSRSSSSSSSSSRKYST